MSACRWYLRGLRPRPPCIGNQPTPKGLLGSRSGGFAGLGGGPGAQQREDFDGKGPDATSASLDETLKSDRSNAFPPGGDRPKSHREAVLTGALAQGVTKSGSSVTSASILFAVIRAIGDCALICAKRLGHLLQRTSPEPQKRRIPSLSTGHVMASIAMPSVDKASLLCETFVPFSFPRCTELVPLQVANHSKEVLADCAWARVAAGSFISLIENYKQGTRCSLSKRGLPAKAKPSQHEGQGCRRNG